jgi:hypothetical protein
MSHDHILTINTFPFPFPFRTKLPQPKSKIKKYISSLSLTEMSKIFKQALLIMIAGGLLAIAGWSSYLVYKHSSEAAEIKKDYSELNSITHGILSVNLWRDHLTNMVLNRIDEFDS